jgi:hypothetical protein
MTIIGTYNILLLLNKFEIISSLEALIKIIQISG